MVESVRAFVAIELSLEMIGVLGELIARLKGTGLSGVRWVNPEAVHLTLKFLGNVPRAQIGEITHALSRSVLGSAPFTLEMGEVGGFPTLDAPRVLWVGLKEELDELASLQQKVEEELQSLGFPKERRPFTAHLTLARMRDGVTSQERRMAGEATSSVSPPVGVAMEVKAISLMESILLPSGAVYNRLASIPLEG